MDPLLRDALARKITAAQDGAVATRVDWIHDADL